MVTLTVVIRCECDDLDKADDKYQDIQTALSSVPDLSATGTSCNTEDPWET